MSSTTITELLKLSPKERLTIVEALWDSLAADPASVPVPPSHVRELKRRMAKYEADPEGNTVSWEEVRAGARRKLGQ